MKGLLLIFQSHLTAQTRWRSSSVLPSHLPTERRLNLFQFSQLRSEKASPVLLAVIWVLYSWQSSEYYIFTLILLWARWRVFFISAVVYQLRWDQGYGLPQFFYPSSCVTRSSSRHGSTCTEHIETVSHGNGNEPTPSCLEGKYLIWVAE